MIQIVGWSKHQHFRDRKPSWIKLHVDLIDDPDNALRWGNLGDGAKAVLVELWLLAAKDKAGHKTGVLAAPEHALARALHRSLEQFVPAVDELVAGGWVVRDVVYQPALFDVQISEQDSTEPSTSAQKQTKHLARVSNSNSNSGSVSGLDTGAEFGTWWAMVTRKETKAKAEALFTGKHRTIDGSRITDDDRQLVLAVWPHHEANWAALGTPRHLKPHPRTWLYQRRFEDEVPGCEAEEATDWVAYADLPAGEAEVAYNRHKGLLVDAEARLDGDAFDTWIEPLWLVGVAPGDVLVLGAENNIVHEWVRDHMQADLAAIAGPLLVVHATKGGANG